MTKVNKTKVKEIYDLNRNLENTRTALKSCKAEKSKLKINKTKLEAYVRKLNQIVQKEKTESSAKFLKSEIKDVNANIIVEASNQPVILKVSSAMMITSMVSHIFPNFYQCSHKPANSVSTITQVSFETVETNKNKSGSVELVEKGKMKKK